MGELVRSFQWDQTSLGAPETWSPALRTMVRFLLANRFPLLLWWGPDVRLRSITIPTARFSATSIPGRSASPVRECWSEIWHILQPLIDTPFHGGPATWKDDIALEINRHGFVEETHFTIAYSPVPDESVPSRHRRRARDGARDHRQGRWRAARRRPPRPRRARRRSEDGRGGLRARGRARSRRTTRTFRSCRST